VGGLKLSLLLTSEVVGGIGLRWFLGWQILRLLPREVISELADVFAALQRWDNRRFV
jgi:hypothetical protein